MDRYRRVLTPVGVARLIARGVAIAHTPDSVPEVLEAMAEQYEELAASCEMVADMERDTRVGRDSTWLGDVALELEEQAAKAKAALEAAVDEVMAIT